MDMSWATLGEPQLAKLKVCALKLSSDIRSYCLLQAASSNSKNIFDNLPSLQAPKLSELFGKLDRYLSTGPKHVIDVLAWWYENREDYLCHHCMALDYLSIQGKFYYLDVGYIFDHGLLLATLVDVEHTFSQG